MAIHSSFGRAAFLKRLGPPSDDDSGTRVDLL